MIDGSVKLGGQADGPVRGHADFLAKFAQDGFARILFLASSAARQPPAGRIAQLDENDLPLGSESQGMGAEGARAPNEPVELEQPMRAGQRQPQGLVDHASHNRLY